MKTEQFEARERAYKRTWAVPLMEATGASTGFCCYALWCGPCASYGLRKRALYNDMSRYLCCAGYLPCSGRCGEQRCPSFCLGVEVCLCFSNSVASTRWMLQDQMTLSNTKCDNCIIATTVFLQYVACIFSLLAICIDGLQEAACILDWTADLLWCSMCACMQTQHKVQLDARDADPSLVQPLHPLMAPIIQTADKTGGQYTAPYGAPPPAGYPAYAAQPATYQPPPTKQ